MNISISELMLILLVALLVIKPAQLPEIAFIVGRFIKAAQRLLGRMKEEMNGLIAAAEPGIPTDVAEQSKKEKTSTANIENKS